MRLRLSSHLRAMIVVQLLSTVVVLGLAAALAPHGTVWVAAGVGHRSAGRRHRRLRREHHDRPLRDADPRRTPTSPGAGRGCHEPAGTSPSSTGPAAAARHPAAAVAVVPQSRSVVVSAFPETEGNGVEVARALLQRYDGTVVWLREAGRSRDVLACWPSSGNECSSRPRSWRWSARRASGAVGLPPRRGRSSSPTVSTAARARRRGSRSSTSGTATGPRTCGPTTASAALIAST